MLPDLPQAQRAAAAQRFLARPALGLDTARQQEWAAETLAVLQHPDFAPLFGQGSRAEVPLAGTIAGRNGPYVVSGQIDRLLIAPERILVIDYKTNRPPPATPEEVAPAYIAQLAAYRVALKGLFPGRSLRAALLWTDGPRLMEIPSTSLDAAEDRLRQRRREP